MNTEHRTGKNIWDIIFAQEKHHFPIQRNYPREPRGSSNPINAQITEEVCPEMLAFVRSDITDPDELYALDYGLNYVIRKLADFILYVDDGDACDCFETKHPPLEDIILYLEHIYHWSEDILCCHDVGINAAGAAYNRCFSENWSFDLAEHPQMGKLARLQQAVQYVIETSDWEWAVKAEGYLKAHSARDFLECDDEVLICLLRSGCDNGDIEKEAKTRWDNYKKDWENMFFSEQNPFDRDFAADGLRFAHWGKLDHLRLLEPSSENAHLLSPEQIGEFAKIFSLFRTELDVKPVRSKLLQIVKRLFKMVTGSHSTEYNYTVFDLCHLCSLLFSFANSRIQGDISEDKDSIRFRPWVREQIEFDSRWSTAHFLDTVPMVTLIALEAHSLYFSRPDSWIGFMNKAKSWLLERQSPYGFWYDGADNPDYTTVLVLDALKLAEGRNDVSFPVTTRPILDGPPGRSSTKAAHIELDYISRYLIIGDIEYKLKGLSWEFIKHLIVSKYDRVPFPRMFCNRDWKYQFDTISRGVGGNKVLNQVIISDSDSYQFSNRVNILGHGQISIKPIRRKR